MNILIMGCSFGVPNYFGEPGAPPEHHTEFLLRDLGYNVFNCASNAGSNLYSLQRAECFLAGEKIHHPAYRKHYVEVSPPSHIDWIVWFHTELTRDIGKLEYVSGKFSDDINALTSLVYSQYQKFQQKHNAKLAVIGGSGDLYKNFYEYFSPEFVVPSWRSEILGIDTIESHTLWQQNYIEQSNDPIHIKLALIENDLKLRELMDNNVDFPDKCHPGSRPHRELVDRLHMVFQK